MKVPQPRADGSWQCDYWVRPGTQPFRQQGGDEIVVLIDQTDYSSSTDFVMLDEVWEMISAWCQNNCRGGYYQHMRSVGFDLEEDAVLFHMTHLLGPHYLPWVIG